MEIYKLAAVLLLVFAVPSVTGEINFRSDQPVDFFNDVNLNGNTLSNLSAPEDNLDAVRRQELTQMLNRTDGTLAGNLNFNGNNAELSGGYISNDGDDEGIRVLDSGEITIENGILDLSGNSLTGLPASDDSNDAVRQDQLSNYVKLNGDTLNGNLSLNNQYYVTDLPDPQNPEDAATKNFVESYSDTNDDVISDNQDLSVSTEASNGGQITIDITNGSSATFMDDYAADDQALSIDSSSTDDIITLDNGGQVTIDDDNTQLDDTGASSNVDMNEKRITNLGEPVNANDAVRLQDVGDGFVNRTGDTLAGSLSFDNTYYITDLPEPQDPNDAATRSYVQTYADTNDATGTDDQNINSFEGTEDTVTLDLENGGSASATINDDFEADTDAQSQCGTGEVLAGSGCVSRYSSGDDGDTSDTNEIQNPTVTTDGDEVIVSLDDGGGSDSASIVDDNTQIDDTGATSNTDMNGYNITSSGGEFCVGQYC